MPWGRFRRWINRDDGLWYRVGNENIRWYQVLGCLLFIGALAWLQLVQRIEPVLHQWPAWLCFGGGVLMFLAPWRKSPSEVAPPN